ncbi:MAG: preprotein translocase subunit SecG [Verrucomicrobia bacterium]|nr:preprotein translocase subunit SecG [Verrucomicrobiota bacterium]
MTILINFLLTLHVIVCVLLVLVVLMQRPKSEGLGAAFGGGFTENIFGAGTTDVLQKFTTWMASAFFLLTAALIFLYAHQSGGKTQTQRNLLKANAPAAGVATSPATTPVATPAASVAATPAAAPTTQTAQPQESAAAAASASASATPAPPTDVPAQPVEPSSPAPAATPPPNPAASPQ